MPAEWKLFGIGIGLYMGEGSKKKPYRVALANTDPVVHRVFIHFLEQFCGVNRAQLSAELNIYAEQDVAATID
ncbi:MAG: hypothetical protein HC893_11775 [Chloroflexaceae bacterium]|nr:hypothetical protein [Chloroflexaceae bacterium]